MFFEKSIRFFLISKYHALILICSLQAAGVERASPPPERGAKGPAAAERQAAAAARADLQAF